MLFWDICQRFYRHLVLTPCLVYGDLTYLQSFAWHWARKNDIYISKDHICRNVRRDSFYQKHSNLFLHVSYINKNCSNTLIINTRSIIHIIKIKSLYKNFVFLYYQIMSSLTRKDVNFINEYCNIRN